MLRKVALVSMSLALAACGATPRPPIGTASVTGARARPAPAVEAPPPPPPRNAPAEHWYFEWLSQDGKRALLRRFDAAARGTLQTRVVDVDSGATIEDESFDKLAKVPFATVGRKAPDLTEEVDDILSAPGFGDDLVRNARLASAFPFGSCGRLSASSIGPVAFNAGDWLYVADKAGRVRKRLTAEAAYDPRFTPDGKHLFFRRQAGTLSDAAGSGKKGFAKYELFVAPADLSSPPRVVAGAAGARDRFAIDPDGKVAIAVVSHEPQIKTCILAIALRPPFGVKRVACLDGGEHLVESVLSPKGKWAALTTQMKDAPVPVAWRQRVVSLATGKVVFDQPSEPGMLIRAISDAGLLVQSGLGGVVVDDVPAKTRRALGDEIEIGYRGFFRGPSELVVLRGSTVGVVDLARD
ncbi:MAG: hypothetical protein KF819_12240 [Labilithrix sp.]|nr:hypothetical protein [Labilithrix sp.]